VCDAKAFSVPLMAAQGAMIRTESLHVCCDAFLSDRICHHSCLLHPACVPVDWAEPALPPFYDSLPCTPSLSPAAGSVDGHIYVYDMSGKPPDTPIGAEASDAREWPRVSE
jgi:hypothetical protein